MLSSVCLAAAPVEENVLQHGYCPPWWQTLVLHPSFKQRSLVLQPPLITEAVNVIPFIKRPEVLGSFDEKRHRCSIKKSVGVRIILFILRK